jgi:hypothetical protein
VKAEDRFSSLRVAVDKRVSETGGFVGDHVQSLPPRVARWFFSDQKSKFGCSTEGLAMEDYVWCFFMDLWSILRPFDIFHDHLIYFKTIWYI